VETDFLSFSPASQIFHFFFGFLVYFLMGLGLNSGLHAFKAGALPLELHVQFILLWLFWKWGLENYLPWLQSSSQSQSPK
jgi:hypothetical protein